MRVCFRSAVAMAIAAALTTSCGGIIDPSKNAVETFSGTIAPQGIGTFHKFSTSSTGEFTVKVTALSPVSNIPLGIDMVYAGSDGSCSSQLYQRNTASLNTPALSGQILSGKYCVVLYDIGAVTVTETYTMTVSHP